MGLSSKKMTRIAFSLLLALAFVVGNGCRPNDKIDGFPWPGSGKKLGNDKKRGGQNTGKPRRFREVEGCKIPSLEGPPLHRLNAFEFDNSVQSILATNKSFAAGFPDETRSGTFDNSIQSLVTSETMVEKFWQAAEDLSALAYDKYFSGCANGDAACFDEAILKLATNAYRRELFPDERASLSKLHESLRAGGGPSRDAAKGVAKAIFMAPQFLFRARLASDEPSINQFALAERLSYFLWSAPPDARLLEMAKSGKLGDQAAVRTEVLRMLSDARIDDFVRSFAGQWLGTRLMVNMAEDNQADLLLAKDFETEALTFFREFIVKNLSIKQLLASDFTYTNARLSEHYGLRGGNGGGEFGKTTLAQSGQRFGILTQGAFLFQTSNPETTSPVKRGKWIMEHVLCDPPIPPPTDQAATFEKLDPNLSMRARLERHRLDPACAGCHAVMDPLGLGLENYDAKGRWRERDRNLAIDPTGTLPEAGDFKTPRELANLLADDARFPKCFTTKLASYALGREPTVEETCVVDKLAEKNQKSGYGLRDLLTDLSMALLWE